MPAYETPDPLHVIVELALGDLRLSASDRTDTVVQVQPKDPVNSYDRQAAAQTRVDLTGGTLTVKSPQHTVLQSVFNRIGTVDVTIELPAGSSVEASTHGRLSGEGRFGDCRLSSAYGDVAVDETARLKAVASYGDVSIGRVTGSADVSATYGTIRAGTITGPAVIKAVSGETSLRQVEGDLRVNSSNGDIVIGRALLDVTVRSANGDIRVEEVVGGVVILEAGTGSIDVGVRHGSATWLDLGSKYGAVRMELTPLDGERLDAVQVRAHTGYGDILIHRSPKEHPHG